MTLGIFYLFILASIAFIVFRWLSVKKVCQNLPNYLREGAIVIDVRSPQEFSAGHFAESKNIPLSSLLSGVSTIKKDQLILLCCASGARSGMATNMLKSNGFTNVVNAGPWQNLLANDCKKN